MELNESAELLMRALAAIVTLPAFAPLVVALTSLLKQVVPAKYVSARTLALAVAVVVWVVWIIARHKGVDPKTFTDAANAVKLVIEGISGILLTTIAASAGYKFLNAKDLPFGATRASEPVRQPKRED